MDAAAPPRGEVMADETDDESAVFIARVPSSASDGVHYGIAWAVHA
jgi:hypothetical protein